MPNLNFSFGFKFDDSAVKVFNQNLTHVNEAVKSFNQSLAHTNEIAKDATNLFGGLSDKLDSKLWDVFKAKNPFCYVSHVERCRFFAPSFNDGVRNAEG